MDVERRIPKSGVDENSTTECSGTKITPFSIADILTRRTSTDENKAIDMSSKCFSCDTQGKYTNFC